MGKEERQGREWKEEKELGEKERGREGKQRKNHLLCNAQNLGALTSIQHRYSSNSVTVLQADDDNSKCVMVVSKHLASMCTFLWQALTILLCLCCQSIVFLTK